MAKGLALIFILITVSLLFGATPSLHNHGATICPVSSAAALPCGGGELTFILSILFAALGSLLHAFRDRALLTCNSTRFLSTFREKLLILRWLARFELSPARI